MARIKFDSAEDETNGIYELMTRGKVVCFPDGVYEVPDRLLSVIDEKGISYTVLKREGEDGVYQALRDAVAAEV